MLILYIYTPSRSLTVRPEKMMLGRLTVLSSPFGARYIFQACLLNFQGCIPHVDALGFVALIPPIKNTSGLSA